MSQQVKILNRVAQLISDGYVLSGDQPNTVILTPKGMTVLMAFADRPVEKAALKKPSLFVERSRIKKAE